MAWTGIARRRHSRDGLRYPSDLTDRDWALISPVIPPAKTGGRRRSTDIREAVNVLLYIGSGGCAWQLLPKCFPPVSTVRLYFYACVLPHDNMFPSGDAVASPECSLRRSVDLVDPMVDGSLRSGAVGEAEQRPINLRASSADPPLRRVWLPSKSE